MPPLPAQLRRAYVLMHKHFGHQKWWPGDTPFEVCVGAILVQNTSWTNVERAIAHLKSADLLEPAKLFALPPAELAQLIRPAGYFNVKAQRLRSFLRVLVEEFHADLKKLFAGETATVRGRLLAIHGIGPETADSLLLYVGGHHSFVIDAYTKRIFERHKWCERAAVVGRARHSVRAAGWQAENGAQKVSRPVSNPPLFPHPKKHDPFSYYALKSLCESALNQKRGAAQLDYWQDYHAQLVMVGKYFCRPREARCEKCPLRPLLPK